MFALRMYGTYFQRYKVPFLIAITLVICESICDLLGPTLMAQIIDQGIAQNNMDQVLSWGGKMLVVTAIGAGFAILRNILASKVSQRLGADLRYDLFSKIIHFSETSADKIESGSLITRMTNDTSQVVQFVNGMMRIFLKAPVTCIGSIVLASILNIRLSLIMYAVVLGVGICIVISMKLSYPRYARLQKAMDRVNVVIQEYLIGVRLVKAFGTYEQETNRFGAANQVLMKSGISSQLIITLIAPLLNLTVGLGTVLVIYLGSYLFTQHLAGAGDVAAFTIYMAQILGSLLMITNVFNSFVRTKASTARLKEILDSAEDVKGGNIVGRLQGAISFDQVTFAYPGSSGVPALKNLSFALEQGQSLAIIGPTGSGKSTIAWLLLRFYEPNEGSIVLDGQDSRDLEIKAIRQNIALVPQNPMLFSGSIVDNIRWGNPQAADKVIQAVVEQAQAGFIDQMPQGYESLLGNAGVNLSGGQKQRLSIARGLLKDAPILILDDATSALDAITEAKVRKHLEQKKGQCTIITITQRCTTAMFSDRILVLENGMNVGFGTHKDLLSTCQVYRDIYQSQVEPSKEA